MMFETGVRRKGRIAQRQRDFAFQCIRIAAPKHQLGKNFGDDNLAGHISRRVSAHPVRQNGNTHV